MMKSFDKYSDQCRHLKAAPMMQDEPKARLQPEMQAQRMFACSRALHQCPAAQSFQCQSASKHGHKKLTYIPLTARLSSSPEMRIRRLPHRIFTRRGLDCLPNCDDTHGHHDDDEDFPNGYDICTRHHFDERVFINCCLLMKGLPE